MERYLLFDAHCLACSSIARSIEATTNGWVNVRSLHDSTMQKLLTQAKSSWKLEPTLLEVRGDQVQAFTGLGLRFQFLLGLGPRQTWYVVQELQKVVISQSEVGSSRRKLFVQGATALGALVFGVGADNLLSEDVAHAATHVPLQSIMHETLEGSVAYGYIQKVLGSPDFQLFRQRVQNEYSESLAIQEHAASADVLKDEKDKQVIVRVPISGGVGHSFYVAVFQQNSFSISETLNGLFTSTGERNVRAVVERNNTIVLDAVLTLSGSFVKGTARSVDNSVISVDGLTVEQAVSRINPSIAANLQYFICLVGCLGLSSFFIGILAAACIVCLLVVAGNPTTIAQCQRCIVAVVGVSGAAAARCAVVCS